MMHDPAEPGAPSTRRAASGTIILRIRVQGSPDDLRVQLVNACTRINEAAHTTQPIIAALGALFDLSPGPIVRVGRVRASHDMDADG